MSNWAFDNFWWLMGGLLALVTGAVVYAASLEAVEHQRLMRQCVADGRKEYECLSMLKRNETAYVPIIIPVGR